MSRRGNGAHPARLWAVACGLTAATVLGNAAMAEEIAPFRLTGVEGHAALSYVGDRSASRDGGPGGASRAGQSDWRNEIFVMTHSYVYHPNFLLLDLGGGPVLQLGELALDGGTTRARSALYNLVGRATFLRGKPVSGVLFYEHLNPVVSIAPGEILNQQTVRYGAEASATAAAVPLPVRVEFTRSETSGRSDERVLDDRQQQLNLRLSHAVDNRSATQVQVQLSRQDSLSGSANLPIHAAATASQALDVDHRLQFGREREHEMIGLMSANSRRQSVGGEALPEQADMNLLVDLRLRNSPVLSSHASFHYSANDNGERTAVTRSGAAGLAWSPSKDSELSLGARAEENVAGPFSLRLQGVSGAIREQRSGTFGTLQAGYSLRHDRRGQRAAVAEAKAVGERLTLSGASPASLALPHVVAGSVLVSSRTRAQTFVENLDYVLSTVGQTTRVQRLVDGNIVDGEEVLVDYAHDLGGSFAYAQTDQTLNLNWAPVRQGALYLREFRSSSRISSGAPTFPLNAVRSRLYGVRADVPVRAGVALAVGGSLERETVAEVIAPSRRQAGDLYVQTEEPLFDLGHLGLTWRRMTMSYQVAAQDMDVRGFSARFATQRFGADLSALLNHECDRGGSAPRCRAQNAINAQWRERKLTMSARLTQGRETQGDSERRHRLFQFTLRRDL